MAGGVGLTGAAGARGKGAARITMRLEGINKVIKEMNNLKEDVPKAVIEETEKELEKLLEIAKANTPVKTGRLQKSGRILKPRVSGGGAVVSFQVIFGAVTVDGRFIDYAWLQHETHATKAFWLFNAGRQILPGLENRVARKVKIRIRG